MKWLFAPFPKNVHFFFFYHLEWLKSINVIWSGWNQNPEAVLSNVAVFHMKWLFAPLTPFRRPKNVHFFFFFHLEWLKSINVIWSGWNLEAVLTNVAVFHMKWLSAPKSPFRWPKNVHFNALEVDQHSTKKNFDQHSTKLFWKLNQFFYGKLFLVVAQAVSIVVHCSVINLFN